MRQIYKKFLMTLVLLSCVLFANAYGYDFVVDEVCYKILSANTCEVAGSSNRNLKSVAIPSVVSNDNVEYLVTSIGEGSFALTGVKEVTIPNSVSSIGNNAFYSSDLNSIVIPEGVISIGHHAFSNCTSLTSVTISSSVTSIGADAFVGCAFLTSVTNFATEPQVLVQDIFSTDEYSRKTLHVLPGCKAKYENAAIWKYFPIVEDAVDTGISSVKNNAIADKKIYSITGQQLKSSARGIRIVGGKKFLVK